MVHGVCLWVEEVGILIMGKSGSGKSSLALQILLDDPKARLVADDHVCLWKEGNALMATAPKGLPHALEVRGVGLVGMPLKKKVALKGVVSLEEERQTLALCGVCLPVLCLLGEALLACPRMRMWAKVLSGNARLVS